MRLLAVSVALLVLAAGASAVVLPATQHLPGASAPSASASDLHGHGGHDHGAASSAGAVDRGEPAPPHPAGDFSWSRPEGRVPEPDDASLRRLRSFEARTDRGLAELAAQGWLTGNGTREDPYVLERLRVAKDLTVADTGAYLIVRENVVLGQLTLNWNGQRLHVHHNHVRDLRVNENVAREGEVTGGLIERNVVCFVGQLRHYSGEFRENRIGPKPSGPFEAALSDGGLEVVPDGEVWNFDGFHGARVHRNIVEGLVDIKLHGHHHGSAYNAGAHEHATDAGHAEGVDHTERHHWLSFHNNTITVTKGAALVYRDTPHAGDDRTAASETNPELELAHLHRTFVDLSHNRLNGGGLVLRVFNSDDERHRAPSEGTMRVVGNAITMAPQEGPLAALDRAKGIGMDLHDAAGLALVLQGNTVEFHGGGTPLFTGKPQGVGLFLRGWSGSTLDITGNAITGAAVGLRARDFDEATRWALRDNEFDAATPVDYDGSVKNEPK